MNLTNQAELTRLREEVEPLRFSNCALNAPLRWIEALSNTTKQGTLVMGIVFSKSSLHRFFYTLLKNT